MKRRIKPDFNRFLAAVTRERLPDRLPVSEIEVDVDVIIKISKMRMPKWIVNKEVKPKWSMT